MDLGAVRVLDLTHLLPGPYATQLLADLGAEVVKIERPDGGDQARHFGTGETDRGHTPLFDVVNRGKRSLALDLKSETGRETFLDLAASADVVVEQFRPGVVDRLGVGYEDVRAVNEDVVYCSLTGYGQTGPDSDRVGHDLNYVGLGGLLDMTRREPDGEPTIPGFPIADMAGGLSAALGIVSALLSRELGEGGAEHLDVAMTDAVLSLSQLIAGPAMAGESQRPGETITTGKYPCYDVYETSDGRYVTLAALEPKFWQAFCEAIDREDLIEAHMAEAERTREHVRSELEAVFAGRTREEWMDRLGDEDVMVGPVKSIEEAFDDPHIQARDLVEDADGMLRRVGFPVGGLDGLDRTEQPAPDLGEHTDEVLGEAGYGDDEIASLRERDVI